LFKTILGVARDMRDELCGHADNSAGAGYVHEGSVEAMIVANEFLERDMKQLQAAVSNGYARGRFEPVPGDRKDWYD
jgi:hypothetical protein